MPDDVFAIRVDKNTDYATAFNALADLKNALNIAFMSQFAARRDAERVTAAEFTELAEQINEALGGAFSRLSVELQEPLARLTLGNMRRTGKIKNLKDAGIKTTIITGISALGRGNDKMRIGGMITDITAAAQAGFTQLPTMFNEDELALRIVNSNSVNASGLLKSEEKQNAEAEAAQKADSAQQMTDNGVDIMKTAMANPEGAAQMGAQVEGMMAQQQQPQQ